MSRSIRLFILIAFLYPASSFSQYFTIDTIKGQSHINKDISYIFPHLTSLTHQAIADMINETLVGDMLQIDSGQQYKSIFERVWGDSDRTMPTLDEISYDEINNDKHFFCIGIYTDGCGAYCSNGTRYFTFDSRSGDEIDLDTLFSKAGLQKVLDKVKATRAERISENVARIKSGLIDKHTSEDDRSYDTMAVSIYADCQASEVLTQYLNFSLDHKQFTIYTDDCLPHMIMDRDEVDYTFTFELKDIKKYLSGYGRSLLKL